MVRVEVAGPNLIVVHDLTVNYDQTPAEAMKGLPHNRPDVANYPQRLWNGGKSGIVEGVSIPLHLPRRGFTIADGRRAQQEIGYGCPADVAALKGEYARKALRAEDLWALVALRQSNEQLWLFDGNHHPVFLDLVLCYHGLSLSSAARVWGDGYGLVGAPQVP